MENDVGRLSASFFFLSESHCEACWKPLVDVYRCANGWLVKFDLAGVRGEDVQVIAQGRRLTVRGIRRDWLIHEGHEAYSLEISYNRFERTLELPVELERAEIAGQFREGMFLVTVSIKENEHDRY